MLLGYHAVQYKDDQIPVPQFGHRDASASEDNLSADERNTGFGVVVPIERVLEIFESEVFKRLADEAQAEAAAASTYKPATG